MTGSASVYLRAHQENRPALVGYFPVGHPSVPHSIDAMKALTTGTTGTGVDLVVIGMPYSDPMMDGTVIQHVTTGALERGVRTRDTLLATEAVAGTGTPCVIMTYWNLVEHYGVDAYARDLASAGGSGLTTPDEAEDRGDSVTVGIDRMCAIVDDLAAGGRRGGGRGGRRTSLAHQSKRFILDR